MLALGLLLCLLVGAVFLAILLPFSSPKNRCLPPSPPGALPFVGHLYLLGKSTHRSLLELAQKHGGLMYLKLGSIHTVVASTPAAAVEVLKKYDQIFASRPAISAAKYYGYGGKDLAWSPYGDYWRTMRKLCTLEVLTSKKVEMFRPVRSLEMSVVMNHLLEACKHKATVSMNTTFYDYTFSTMTRIISFPGASKDETAKGRAEMFKQTVNELDLAASIADFIPHLRWLDFMQFKLKSIQQRLDSYMEVELQEHKKRWTSSKVPQDFIDVLLSIGNVEDVSIKALALDMILAGMETSSRTAEWAFAELIRNPQAMQKAQQELDNVVGKRRTLSEEDVPKLEFLQAVVKETLRLHPLVPLLLPHESTRACDIWGYHIPAATRLLVNVYAIGRDGSVWKEPDKFDPERFLGEKKNVDVKGQNFELLPFGAGRRMCPGVNLGLTMVHYMLGSLVHAFDWQLPDGCEPEKIDMAENVGLTAPRAGVLQLIPSARLSPDAYDEEVSPGVRDESPR